MWITKYKVLDLQWRKKRAAQKMTRGGTTKGKTGKREGTSASVFANPAMENSLSTICLTRKWKKKKEEEGEKR